MRKIIFLILLLPLLANAQENGGIRFEKGPGWQQILASAHAQNKYVFVDCYATWCGPCKAMDKYVYPRQSVGDYMNPRFVCVKVQMDSSSGDDAQVQRWYADAHYLRDTYRIANLPSYLFFSPDGRLVYRSAGMMKDSLFVQLAAGALDHGKQYNTEVELWRQGRLDYGKLPGLIQIANALYDSKTAREMAGDYLHNYLDHLGPQTLLSTALLEQVASLPNLITPQDSVFTIFYAHRDEVNRIMKDDGKTRGRLVHGVFDFAGSVINQAITRADIYPKIEKDGKPVEASPDWNGIRKDIAHKYPVVDAESLVLDAQLIYYAAKKDWRQFADLRDLGIKKYPPMPPLPGAGLASDTWGLNRDAWTIFLECNDKRVLEKALAWSDLSMKLDSNPQYLDTRANLLYKLGRTREAITQEEKAAENPFLRKMYLVTVEKMKKGEPTWPENE